MERRTRGYLIQVILLITVGMAVYFGYRHYSQSPVPTVTPVLAPSSTPTLDPSPLGLEKRTPASDSLSVPNQSRQSKKEDPTLAPKQKVVAEARHPSSSSSPNPRRIREADIEEPLESMSPTPDDVLLWDDYGGKYSTEATQGKIICDRIEYRGHGTANTQHTQKELNTVLNFFHEAQRLLVDWITRDHDLTPETVAIMKKQIQGLRLVFPPPLEQPDLTWRGIGIWTHSDGLGPAVQLGNGYVKLVFRYPKRALFEMTRLIAQSWTPCELKRMGVASPWDPLLDCLNITEREVCSKGGYSTTGWGISSILAYTVASPGCTLPIFLDEKKARCFKTIQKLRMPSSLSTDGKQGKKSQS